MKIFFTKYLPLYDCYYVLFEDGDITKNSVAYMRRAAKFSYMGRDLCRVNSLTLGVYDKCGKRELWLRLVREDAC